MKYEEPNMEIIIMQDDDIPITMVSGQIEVGNPFEDLDDSGLPDD